MTPTSDPREGRIAELLADRYELLEFLGKGGFAAVYKVRNLRLGRVEALKVLAESRTEEPDFARRFEQEAHVAASLDHPNIVKIYDYGQGGNIFWFSMQFISGKTVGAELRMKGLMDEGTTARIAVAVLDALDYSHSHGVIHRDIKPDNIILDARRRPYLMDFGIAKSQDSLVQTHAGLILGSPAYLSPEQITGGQLDGRADLYALGVTLYKMLTGSLPFVDDDTFRAAMKRLVEPPEPLSSKRADVHPRLEAIVMRALERDTSHRFADAHEMREAIEDFLFEEHVPLRESRMPTLVLPISEQPPAGLTPTPTPYAAGGIAQAVPAGLTPTPATVSGVTAPSPSAGEVSATQQPARAPSVTAPPRAPSPRRHLLPIALLLVGATGAVVLVLRIVREPGTASILQGLRRRPAVEKKAVPPATEAVPGPPQVPAGPSTQAKEPTVAEPAARFEEKPASAAPTPLPGPARREASTSRRTTERERSRILAPRQRKKEAPPVEPPPRPAETRTAVSLPELEPGQPLPQIPPDLQKAVANQSVGLMVTVGEDGRVKNAKVISSVCATCDRVALEAVQRYRFRPARDAEGRPVEKTFAFSIRF